MNVLIDFIIGKIVSKKDDYIVIQNNGIGYKVFTSENTMSKLLIGEEDQILYTQLHSRDDGIFLYGFSSEDEMEMFNLLILVSRVGPKSAIGILSNLTPNQIKLAIVNNDIDELCKGPGVGKKTAERIIVELKDRVDISTIDEESAVEENVDSKKYSDCVEALSTLGYTRYEVENAIRGLDLESMDLEKAIKEGLKKLSKQ